MARVALVAGASSGLGRAVAQRLAADGLHTYAGARSFDGTKTPPGGCEAIVLDVTDASSVEAAVARVMAREGRIDVLVNCAARIMLGSCEDTSPDELLAVMETNFLGMVRMTQSVLPVMRSQGSGRILQLSSLNGRFAIPFQGAYAASKHALEGWNEALSMEASRFGILVTLMEPGDCRGGSDAYRDHAKAAPGGGSPYYAHYQSAAERIYRDEHGGMHPGRVARAVSRTLQKKHPPLRIVVARIDQRLALWLHTLLPGRLFHRVIIRYYGGRRG